MGCWWQRSIAELAWVWLVVSDRGCGLKVLRKVWVRVSLKGPYGVLVAVLDRGTGWEVWSRVSVWVWLEVSDCGCGRKVLRKVLRKVSLGPGASLVLSDHGCCRGVSLRVLAEVWLGAFDRGCRWKVSQEALPRVSLMLLDPGCGRGMWRRVSLTVWCGGGEAGSRLWQGGVAHVAQQSLLLMNFCVAT